MSEEVAMAAGDIAYWQRRAEQAEAKVDGLNLAADQYSESRDQWMLKAKAAEADAAAVRTEILERAMKDAEDTHRLQAYCAQLLTELEAARAVVTVALQEKKIAKYIWTQPGESTNAISDFEIALDQALAAYDEATKASAPDGR